MVLAATSSRWREWKLLDMTRSTTANVSTATFNAHKAGSTRLMLPWQHLMLLGSTWKRHTLSMTEELHCAAV